MSTVETLLQKFTNTKEALQEHIRENQAVFSAHEKLVMYVIDAENELRDAVAESGQGINNGLYDVVVTPQTQRIYNEDNMHQYLNATQFADIVNDVKRPARITIREIGKK